MPRLQPAFRPIRHRPPPRRDAPSTPPLLEGIAVCSLPSRTGGPRCQARYEAVVTSFVTSKAKPSTFGYPGWARDRLVALSSGRNVGEDGLCATCRTAGAPRPTAVRAARASSGHAHRAPHRVRRAERPDAGAGPLQGQHLHRRRRPRFLSAPGHRPRRVAAGDRPSERLHRRPGDDRGRRLHRRHRRAPRTGPPLRRGRQRQHRGHAGCPLLPRSGGRRVRARAAGDLHAQPGRARLPGRSPDRGQPRSLRHPRLQLRLLRRVEEGRPAHVEPPRLRTRRPGPARRLQDDPDRAPASRPA